MGGCRDGHTFGVVTSSEAVIYGKVAGLES